MSNIYEKNGENAMCDGGGRHALGEQKSGGVQEKKGFSQAPVTAKGPVDFPWVPGQSFGRAFHRDRESYSERKSKLTRSKSKVRKVSQGIPGENL